jgi:hypothetical protein
MKVRTQQIQVLGESTSARFLDRLVELVSGGEPPKDEPALRKTCQELMKRADAYGLTTEFEVAAFVACGVMFGMDFDSRSDLPYQKILTEADVEPRLKAAQLAMTIEKAEEEDSAVEN